jgi:hypothetical protein
MDRTAPANATLILFPGALGDTVCLEPTVARLAADGPVLVWARDAAKEVATLFPSRPRVESLDRREVAALFAPAPSAGCTDPGAAFLATFARVRSFTGASAPELVQRFQGHPDARAIAFPARDGRLHASHVFLRGAVGDAQVMAPFPRLVAAEAAEDPPMRLRLVMHPGSGGREKRVSDRIFTEVALTWRERGGPVDVLLGPAERDEREPWSRCGAVVLPHGVAALAGILTGAGAYLGHDSGPSHVAAALGVPTTVLFAASTPESFGPRGPDVRWVDVRPSSVLVDVVEAVWSSVTRRLP